MNSVTPTPTPTYNIMAIDIEEMFIEGIILIVFGILLFFGYLLYILDVYYYKDENGNQPVPIFYTAYRILRGVNLNQFNLLSATLFLSPFIVGLFITILGAIFILESKGIQNYIYIEKKNTIDVKLLTEGSFILVFSSICFLICLFFFNRFYKISKAMLEKKGIDLFVAFVFYIISVVLLFSGIIEIKYSISS